MVELIVLPLQCILVSILVCMISLKIGGGGGGGACPPASYPPVLAQSYVTPLPKYVGSMIVLVYLIVLLLFFAWCPYIAIHHLYTCFAHFYCLAVMRMRTLAPRLARPKFVTRRSPDFSWRQITLNM